MDESTISEWVKILKEKDEKIEGLIIDVGYFKRQLAEARDERDTAIRRGNRLTRVLNSAHSTLYKVRHNSVKWDNQFFILDAFQSALEELETR